MKIKIEDLLKIESNEEPEVKTVKLESIPALEPVKQVVQGNKTLKLKLKLTHSLEQSLQHVTNKFSFHLGNHAFKFKSLKSKEKLFEINNQVNIFLYESNLTKSKSRSYIMNQYAPKEEPEYFILLINGNESIWLELNKLDELDRSVLNLTMAKCLTAVFNSISRFESSLNIELYLTDKLNKNSELTNEPSLCFKTNNSYHMNLIMTKFYFSLIETNLNNEHINVKDHQLTDSESKQTNENLFDMIYDLRESNDKQHDLNLEMEESKLILLKSNLKPLLRPYQIKAISWMLKKELFEFNESNHEMIQESNTNGELHPLFVKITDKYFQSIYYHKYLGLFTTDLPKKLESERGGILADEMGLGKTLEILAGILINTRSVLPELPDIKPLNLKKLNDMSSFSCLCGQTPANFKSAYNGSNKSSVDLNTSEINQCITCGTWTHVDCVNYRGEPEKFICLKCTTQIPPIPSGATLIVTPSQISRQWIDEIEKHVNKNLKVLFYTGCNQKYVQPKDLASLDICITTYDVLSAELSHVFAIDNMHDLRKAKRFMNIPSPLICVEWWRICLDEAQMVHSTNSKCAEMASRLHAINRWCVTGTPIGRSLTDLHGLFTFIREDPYIEKKWFNEILYFPYMKNDKMPLVNAVSKVLWRTAKKYVEDQINIPKQTEKVYWLNFSPFEKHLYERVLETFRKNRVNQFKSTVMNRNANSNERNNNNNNRYFLEHDKNLRLDEMERATIDHIMAPLLDLRLACNHPQLVLRKKTFMTQGKENKKDKLLSMEKSLQLLIKKTEKECENILRIVTMHSNAIAGLYLIEENYLMAKQIYQKILDSESNFEIRLDLLQKVHTIFNYIYVLNTTESPSSKNNELITDLNNQLNRLENKYTSAFDETKMKDEFKLKEKINGVNVNFIKNFKDYKLWLLSLIKKIEISSSLSKEFWERLGSEFQVHNTRTTEDRQINRFTYKIFNKICTSYDDLKLHFVNEFDNLLGQRKILLQKTKLFFKDQNGITAAMVSQAADCHLRKQLYSSTDSATTITVPKCDLCICDKTFREYSNCLYANSDEAIRLASSNRGGKTTTFESDDEQDFTEQYQGHTKTISDFENFNKVLTLFLKNLNEIYDSEDNSMAKQFSEDFSLLKEEFKFCREYWISVSNTVNSFDELDMVKTRMRLRQPNEINHTKSDHILDPEEVDSSLKKNLSDKTVNEIDLKKKYGQLVYLKSLMKTNLIGEDQENQELCPICQSNLGFEWQLLTCGHSYCKTCYLSLINIDNPYMSERARSKHVKCSMCREDCLISETHVVSTKKKVLDMQNVSTKKPIENLLDKSYNDYINNDLCNIKIAGNCNSAKVEGIVKCLIKILRDDKQAKCIVFSEHVTMLELCQELLKDNYIDYKLIKDNNSFQKNIQEFKTNPRINVLLMPYTFGANGLNIIEATHVLLVEPTLNRSQELQAIGRVDRIGQTKPTVVYRFVMRETVEETVYNLFKFNKISTNEPNSSAAFAAAEIHNDDDYEKFNQRKVIRICDVEDLFNNL